MCEENTVNIYQGEGWSYFPSYSPYTLSSPNKPPRSVAQWVERSLRVRKVGYSNSPLGQVRHWKIGTCCFPCRTIPWL